MEAGPHKLAMVSLSQTQMTCRRGASTRSLLMSVFHQARLALQLEARELADYADSARNGFVPGWHVRTTLLQTQPACGRLQGVFI